MPVKAPRPLARPLARPPMVVARPSRLTSPEGRSSRLWPGARPVPRVHIPTSRRDSSSRCSRHPSSWPCGRGCLASWEEAPLARHPRAALCANPADSSHRFDQLYTVDNMPADKSSNVMRYVLLNAQPAGPSEFGNLGRRRPWPAPRRAADSPGRHMPVS